MSVRTSVDNYNRAFRIYDKINQAWSKINSGESTNPEYDVSQLLLKLRKFRKFLNGVSIAELKSKYPNDIKQIQHNMNLFNEAFYYIERDIKGIRYADNLKTAVNQFIEDMRLEPGLIRSLGGSVESAAKRFIAAITKVENVLDYENEIKRMMKGKMSQKEFEKIFNTLKPDIIPAAKSFQSLKDYTKEKKRPAYGFRIKKRKEE